MNKETLRKQYRTKRAELNRSERLRMDDLMLIQFQQWVIPDFVQTILSYWPIRQQQEVNTFLIKFGF